MPSKLGVNGEGPRRPSSIALPNEAGMEGFEYTSYDQLPPEAKVQHGEADTEKSATAQSEQTSHVSADIPLHAPKAALPVSAAKRQIQTVTRTDSTQAAAAGIGMAQPDDDVHTTPADSQNSLSRVTSRTEQVPLRAKPSFNRSSSSLGQHGTPKPPSMHSEQKPDGIPEIGMQIPLYPNAGDVQAPSPAQTQSQFTPGIGFFNDGMTKNHHRKRSSRQEFGPSDSYGLHFSGEPTTQFERDWLLRHPEEAARAGWNPYAERPDAALSTEQLNRLVNHAQGVGFGG